MRAAVNVAIVGCGRMGAERAKHVEAAGGRIAACIDTDPARSKALAERYPGAYAGAHIEEIAPDLQAAFLCVPPAGRLGLVRALAERRVALFLEKPLAATLDEATEMCRVLARTPVVNGVGYMNRYRAGVNYARSLLRGGTELVGITCVWGCGRYGVPWWSDRRASGGPLNEQGTHLLDLCRYIGGEISTVLPLTQRQGERAASAFEFENGAVGTLLYTCETTQKVIGMTMIGRSGSVRLDGWAFQVIDNTIDGKVEFAAENPFAVEVCAFLQAVRAGDGAALRSTVSDAYRTQALMARLTNERAASVANR